MKPIISRSLLALFIMAMVPMSLFSQGLQSSLFDDVNRSMSVAKHAQADVLSPRAFGEAMENYKEAKKNYNEDGDLADIRKDISEAKTKFQESTENTKVGTVLFSSALSARRDALSANADGFVKEMWADAEEEMKEAAEKLEKGDSDKAKEKAKEATALYRKAELESIKANYLTNAKNLIKKADDEKVDKVAPKTLSEAKNLVVRAEKELLDNRYDTDQARFLAQQAEYKALLAIHIAKEEKILDDKDFEAEDYLLMTYAPITKIGESLNIDMKFDNGTEKPVSTIIERINNDQQHANNLQSLVYSQQMSNVDQKAMLVEQQKIIAGMEGELTAEAIKGQKRQMALQNRIDRMEEIDAKFEESQQIFNQTEALVFRQRDDIIIRLIGVNFEVNESQIQKEDYALLTKLQKVMGIFKDASIVIEGHTDSQGGDDLNLKLSQERADAVLAYLNANTTIDKTKFSTVGFGESKPIANNETEGGRKLNRHIDVVIKPNLPAAPLTFLAPK